MENPVQVFSCEHCGIFKSTFFTVNLDLDLYRVQPFKSSLHIGFTIFCCAYLYVYILKEYMLFIVHCYPNDYFCFLQIRQNIPAYVNRKGINQKFWSILNLLHSFTSYLFNKKNSGIAGGFEVMFRQSPRNQEAYSESCRAFKSDLQTELITKNSILYNWQGSLIRL